LTATNKTGSRSTLEIPVLLICKQQTPQNDGAMVVHCKQYKKESLEPKIEVYLRDVERCKNQAII
jgi:hypothetical protein